MSIPATKVCKRCMEEKSSEHFSPQIVKHSYGTYEYLHTYCKKCACVIAAENWKKKPKKPKKLNPRITPTTKFCAACGIEKPHAEFHKKTGRKGDRFGLGPRCKTCEQPRKRRWHVDNAVRTKSNRKSWYDANKEHVSHYNKRKHESNPGERARRFRQWAAAKGPQHFAAKTNARKARQTRAQPPWLSFIQLAQIEEFYEIAAAKTTQTGINHHVDHIFPLSGKSFRGLHVPWNLQVIPAFDNISKKNGIPKEYASMFWEGI